jgi:hypothetical protein
MKQIMPNIKFDVDIMVHIVTVYGSSMWMVTTELAVYLRVCGCLVYVPDYK